MSVTACNQDWTQTATMIEDERKTLRMQGTIDWIHLVARLRRPGNSPEFMFFDDVDDVPPRMLLRCAAQFDFLQGFKENWRPPSSKSFGLPQNWLEPEIGHTTRPSRGDFVASQVAALLETLEGDFYTLSDAEIAQNSTDSQSWVPDFLLSSPPRYIRPYASGLPDTAETFFRPNARRSVEQFLQIMYYDGYEGDLMHVMVNALRNIPGSFPIGSPVLDFPSDDDVAAFNNNNSPPCTDFAFVLNFFGSERLLSQVDSLPISVGHPALLVGIESSSPLVDAFNPDVSVLDASAPNKLTELRQKLSQAAQNSLDTHVLNWLLTHPDQMLDSLPPWLMVFGLVYDDASLQIVAHIPYLDSDDQTGVRVWGYMSFLVDEIPFDPTSSSSPLDRLRLAMALFSLQRHIFRLSAVWEPSADYWPLSIRRMEVERDELYIQETTSDVDAFDDGLTGAFNDNKSEELLQAERFIAMLNMDASSGHSGDCASMDLPAASHRLKHYTNAVLDWLQGHPEDWEDLAE